MSLDDLVIGGGHNGLTAAALLAKGGRRVAVLEQRDEVGGLAGSIEFHPGYRSPGILHDTSLVRSNVVETLQLERHGLRRYGERTELLVPSADGPGLLLHPDPARMAAQLTEGDAAGYAAFRGFLQALKSYVRGLLDEPPPSIAPRGVGEHWALFRRVLGLRRLGRKRMYECLRMGPMGVWDWLSEHFQSGPLQVGLAGPALVGSRFGPRAAGTAALLLMHECLAQGEFVGGPAALVRALEKACRARGVEIRTGAKVRRILVGNGRVTGVELEGGERIDAERVASSVEPSQTFLELLAPRDLPVGLEAPLRNWRCRGTTGKVHLALDGPLEFSCRPGEQFRAACVVDDLEQLERAFDGVKYRQMPEVPHLDIRVPTVDDPGLAPDGHHVVSILVHAVPHDLEGSWTDGMRDELLKRTLAALAKVSPSCADRIVGHQVLTPADLERDYALTGGQVHHGEHGLDQLGVLRPTASCARYAAPLSGLFLCGSGSHPGGGITCAPGMLGAAAMG